MPFSAFLQLLPSPGDLGVLHSQHQIKLLMGNRGGLCFPDGQPGRDEAVQPHAKPPWQSRAPACSGAENPPPNLCFIEEHRGIFSGCA